MWTKVDNKGVLYFIVSVQCYYVLLREGKLKSNLFQVILKL